MSDTNVASIKLKSIYSGTLFINEPHKSDFINGVAIVIFKGAV